ncbi:HAD-IA family hydrolase [Glaciecola siphonariae]|uniref:HAD-IA family hydrolase n=1 Tax=Glaciecola siphonariae TaxID=521012 RepID=A0ABV9LYY9_9ALTE
MIVYKPLGIIKAITFDLDDTFYANWPYIVEAEQHLREFIAEHYPQAAHYDSADWLAFKKQALEEDPALRHDMGELRTLTLTKAFVNCGVSSDKIPEAVSQCFDTFYHKRSDFSVDKSIHKALRKLAKRVPLVAITNGNVNVKQIGIAKYFTHVLHSSKSRRMKPHSDMFIEAARLLDLRPNQILHVGDNLEKDVWGATQAGYYSAWFAYDRDMVLSRETVRTLPHLQLQSIAQLKKVLKGQKQED